MGPSRKKEMGGRETEEGKGKGKSFYLYIYSYTKRLSVFM